MAAEAPMYVLSHSYFALARRSSTFSDFNKECTIFFSKTATFSSVGAKAATRKFRVLGRERKK